MCFVFSFVFISLILVTFVVRKEGIALKDAEWEEEEGV